MSEKAAEEIRQKAFEAQLARRRDLDERRDRFAETIGRLRQRRETLVLEGKPENDKEILQLQETIDIAMQGLEACKVATEGYQQKIHTFGEMTADDNSDHVVITTVADIFDAKNSASTKHSAQLVGSVTPYNFEHLTEKRYNSRFGVSGTSSSPTEAGATRSPPVQKTFSHHTPSPNEGRKRSPKDDVDE